MNHTKRGIFTTTMVILTLLFFYLPMAVLLLYSFNSSKSMVITGFSLKWYNELFTNSPFLWKAVSNSLIIAVSSAFSAVLIGTLGAIGLRWYSFKLKNLFQIISMLPLLLPEIILGVALLIFFSAFSFPQNLFTVYLSHITFNIPFVLLIVMARLEEFDSTLLEAARDLGAREIDVLMKILIPLTMPAIIAALLMSFTLSLEDFVITFFISGPGSTTLPIYIYSMIRFGVSPVINALSVLI